MASTNPEDFVYVPASNPFNSICDISWFAFNLAYYVIFSSLLVFTIYKVGKAIQHVAQSDSSETMEKLRENATDIALSIIGLLVISSIFFFPKVILSTMGVPDSKNPFISLPSCP